MTTRLLPLLFVLLTAAPLSAQTVVTAFDRFAYPEIGIWLPVPVDLDADLTTREAFQQDGVHIRGLAARDGRLCIGEWFNPFDQAFEASKLIIRGGDMMILGLVWNTQIPARYTVLGLRGLYEIEIGYGC